MGKADANSPEVPLRLFLEADVRIALQARVEELLLASSRYVHQSQRSLDVPLSSSRFCWRHSGIHAQAAKRFFRKALHAKHTVKPRVINVDRNPAYPKAANKLKRKDTLLPGCELRPVKYLNNLIEQDHCFINCRVNPGLGFWSFDTAWRTLQGYEATNQLRKRQVRGTTKGDVLSQVRFVSAAFGLAA